VVAALIALALTGHPATTHDVLPIFLGDRGPVFFAPTGSSPLASRLHVFRTPRSMRDLLPRTLLDQAMNWSLDGILQRPDRSRRLVSNLYGIPESNGDVCFFFPDTRGYCRASLLHGAYPFVDARFGVVYGLLSDKAVRVEVDGRRARIGRNAFYVRASRVRTVVVTDRDGARHVYTFYPCEVTEPRFQLVERPLDPLPDYCA
jgi:hypothetical protein